IIPWNFEVIEKEGDINLATFGDEMKQLRRSPPPPSGSVNDQRSYSESDKGIRSRKLRSRTGCDDRHDCSRWVAFTEL
ncbi:hypothetical protein BHE74_00030378, partial [Ensete ventricosum]